MRLKRILIIGTIFPVLFSIVLFFGILISGEDDDSSNSYSTVYSGMNLSADVLKHQPMVEKYARENGITEYVNVLLAIIQVESGGTATDVMQSSESLGLPPNSLSTEESIKQGCKYFASLLSSCKAKGMNDINVVIQSYNYGGGYADYVAKNGKKHSFNLAENFAKNKSGGTKVTYTNPIAVSKNGGWRYNYGNMFYVELVNQYLTVKQFSNETVQAVMNEALKYQGWKYVYGGSNPNTSFDCSDNGKLPFICWLDDPEEVKDEEKWQKANPSLRNFPTLLTEMRMEYEEYKLDPVNHTSFMTKRMNRPPGETQYCVTDWKNLEKATRSLPDLRKHSCVAGIDYSKTNDFVAAGLLFKVGDKRYWMHHTWVCKKSRDLPRIKYPLKEAEEEGVLTMVDDVEIDPEYVTDWLLEKSKLYKIESVVMDNFRQTWLREALGKIGFSDEKKNLKLIRPSDEMKVAPVIGYMFARGLIAWGTSKIMRWYTWNSKAVTDKKGNVTYEKIEPRSRKTDGFKAFVAAVTNEERIKQRRIIKNRISTVC